MKERPRRIHPSLLWENVDKYPDLNARTVTADGAMARLTKIGGIVFSEEDKELIRSLRATRSAIEHYIWINTKSEAELIVGEGLAFALEFSLRHLEHSFFGYRTRQDSTYENLIHVNQPFASAIQKRSQVSVSVTSTKQAQCSICRAIAVSSSTGACRICGHWKHRERVVAMGQSDDDIPF